MDKAQIKALVNMLSKAGALKDIERTGWVLKGTENAESVADHTWRMSLLILLLASKELDKQKLLEMNVIHDLGEIGVGDIKWESGKRVISSQTAKHRDEIKATDSLFGDYEDKDYYLDLLQEFNEQKTRDAKFLKQVDKLEMALQALEYEKAGHNPRDLNEFWENTEKYLEGQSLEPIFRYLQKLREKSPS